MLKALVTGGAGFIGYHLARTLAERDYQVDILDNRSGPHDSALTALLAEPNVRMIEADLRDRPVAAALDTDYDRIFHLAAVGGTADTPCPPYEVMVANVAMLETIVAAAKRQRALGRLLLASTGEAECADPSPHALSAQYAEAMCRFSGVPFTITRFHNVYGPRMDRAHPVAMLLERAHRLAPGQPFEVPGDERSRTFCHVDDAVEHLFRMSMLPGCTGQTFDVGTQAPELRVDEVARLVLEVVGGTSEVVLRSEGTALPVWRTPQTAKAFEATGFRSRIEPRTGIQRTYDWCREHLFGQPEAQAA